MGGPEKPSNTPVSRRGRRRKRGGLGGREPMRKLMGMAGMLAVALVGAGCAMTGGICDCAPVPGDSTGYNPHVTYHATCPGGCPTPPSAAAPVTPTTSVSKDSFEPASLP